MITEKGPSQAKVQFVCGLLMFMSWFVPVLAADIYVSPAGGGAGTPADPTDLQTALATAQTNGENDVIYLQQGFYDASTAGANTYTYDTISNDNMAVLMSGGWDTDFTTQSTDPLLTQLDGGSNARILQIESNAPGVTIVFEIEYLTFQNGNVVGYPGSYPYYNGAGILAYSGVAGDGSLSLIVRHCRFDGNDADNSATGHYGGGIFSACTLEVDDCTFVDNAAMRGGGIWLNQDRGSASTAPLVHHCVFEDNRSIYSGGGIGTSGTQPMIQDCFFTGVAIYGSGTAYLHLNGGTSTLSRCQFIENHGQGWGGAIDFWDAGGLISDSVFYGNTGGNCGDGAGGAITIYDPSSSSPRTVTITNCTFAGNTTNGSQGYGDAISNRVEELILVNCVFWENDGAHGVRVSSGGTGTASYCDFQGGVPSGMTDGGNNMNLDPDFKDLASGDLDLKSTSPCIDMGDDAAPGIGTWDVAGRTRIVDGDGDGQADVDLGAYEYASPLWPLLPTWHVAPEYNDIRDFIEYLFF